MAELMCNRAAVAAVLLCLCMVSVQAGKLLVIPTDGSHWMGIKPLVDELGKRGNQVLLVMPEVSGAIGPTEHTTSVTFPVPYTKTQYLSMNKAHLDELMAIDPSNLVARVWAHYKTLEVLKNYTLTSCRSLLYNKELMQILRNWQFDAVLTDPFEPAGVIVGAHLKIPAVYVLNSLPCGADHRATRCPMPSSYVPSTFSHYSHHMTMGERTVNFLQGLLEPLACRYLYAPANELASAFLERETTIPELMSEAALWLLRRDWVFEFPRPTMPNLVTIGGVNCKETTPLPSELQEFVEGSGEHGFIVFTLGSMVSVMPEEKAKQFFEAFRKIPQRVVWRYTGAVPENAPKNVKLMKWLPQNDLLGHPKAKVFMTHGGTHGIYEGICNGVPMVMMPLFGDQGDNVHRMVARGVAEDINMFELTTDILLQVLNKVINDKSYKEKMMKLSAVHLDRPIEPLDLAVFWTEFVMRHKGAAHLRPAAHDLNWVQYHSLDVIGLLLLILITVVVVTLKSCLFCVRKCCLRQASKTKRD